MPVLEPRDNKPAEVKKHTKADILVAGAVALDLSCDYVGGGRSGEVAPKMQTSNPSRINQSVGGVGHNVALAAHLVSQDTAAVRLCSMVGDDV